jgi:hypothetical protein
MGSSCRPAEAPDQSGAIGAPSHDGQVSSRWAVLLSVTSILRRFLRRGQGPATFEYDRPSTLFGQYGDERVTAVARELDRQIHDVLIEAAQ